jgi:hypothetical protein
MKTRAEKRTYERCGCTALIAFSYFNKKKCFNVKAINHSEGGMSFKSSFFLQPGATVYIRAKKNLPNGSGTVVCKGLRSVTLAEVKWCNEELDADAFPYRIGAKYYEPVY